ncbi:hypothetical protein KL86DYS2_11282 [uncultured Dysgonomonas sp.]|uniref:Uncharacterized protein n=1 Tax=uncultured Dysgonomonas sp. TaxID=206096 RepID=A0A212JDH4_9BACT|nr:hypothetical protein KL86DYS2_11282 [uncultured Dysgonomonas sp.]
MRINCIDIYVGKGIKKTDTQTQLIYIKKKHLSVSVKCFMVVFK